MAYNIKNIKNKGGDLRLGNKNEGSEITSESQNFNIDDLENEGGNMHVGDENINSKVKNKWVWIITAIGVIILGLAAYYFK